MLGVVIVLAWLAASLAPTRRGWPRPSRGPGDGGSAAGESRSGRCLVLVVGNVVALPLYSLIWRAGRVGGRAALGQPPAWSFSGLAGTLRFAASESWEPICTSLVLAAAAATIAVALAWGLAWVSRKSRPWQAGRVGTLALTLATPGPVAGMALVLAYLRFPRVYDSPVMIVLAQSMRTLPYALLVLWPVAANRSPASCSTPRPSTASGRWGRIRRVALPLSARALLAAWGVALRPRLSASCPRPTWCSPRESATITFRIWGLLHTGVESHLAGVALVTLGVITLLVLLMILAAWLSKSPPTGDQTSPRGSRRSRGAVARRHSR